MSDTPSEIEESLEKLAQETEKKRIAAAHAAWREELKTAYATSLSKLVAVHEVIGTRQLTNEEVAVVGNAEAAFDELTPLEAFEVEHKHILAGLFDPWPLDVQSYRTDVAPEVSTVRLVRALKRTKTLNGIAIAISGPLPSDVYVFINGKNVRSVKSISFTANRNIPDAEVNLELFPASVEVSGDKAAHELSHLVENHMLVCCFLKGSRPSVFWNGKELEDVHTFSVVASVNSPPVVNIRLNSELESMKHEEWIKVTIDTLTTTENKP